MSGATPFYCPVKLRFCVRSNSCIVVRFRPIFAQFERSLIQERVKAGLEAAKNRGIRGGRPRAISEEKMIAIKKALNDGMSKASICRTFEVKRSTLIDSLNREII